MKNPFSKCVKIRRRVKKHKLNTKYASNYGAFHWDNSNFGESYSKKQSHDERNEATEQRQNSSREILSITASEMCFNSREDFISKLDLDISYVKEFTNEVKEKIYFLLNVHQPLFMLDICWNNNVGKPTEGHKHEWNRSGAILIGLCGFVGLRCSRILPENFLCRLTKIWRLPSTTTATSFENKLGDLCVV